MNPIEKNAIIILKECVERKLEWIQSESIAEITSLSADDINDAVDYLEDLGAIRVESAIGTAPYRFVMFQILTRGRFLYNEIIEKSHAPTDEGKEKTGLLPKRPLNPVGSPYGFTENDWDRVALQKEDRTTLYVVMGMQFHSEQYDSENLIKNIEGHFRQSLESYNSKVREKIKLNFEKLESGYGEHLFNTIAAAIIGADIAIFETSDKNANVMIELGVALTWGIRVLPIRERNSPDTPSDILGHVWIKYEDSGRNVLDENFHKKLEEMIKRNIAAKGR